MIMLWLICAAAWTVTPASAAPPSEIQQSLSLEELKVMANALIDLDEATRKLAELTKQLTIADDQAALFTEQVRLERQAHLDTKKLHLQAILALQAYRTKKRPMALRILTFGLIHDRRDPSLQAEIDGLRMEIANWTK